MKVWLKFLIGSMLGAVLGFLLPSDNQTIIKGTAWLAELAISLGRYALVPILVFSLTIAVYELRQDNQFWRHVGKTFAIIVCTSVFVITAGILVTLLFPPARIPILIEEQTAAISLNITGNILRVFPANMLTAVLNDGIYLLPG